MTPARRTLRAALVWAAATVTAAAVLPAAGAAQPPRARDADGHWKVATSGVHSYRVTWTSPTPLPVTDARPEITVDGRWAGPAALSADGRHVSVAISATARPPTKPEAETRALAADPGRPGRHRVVSS